MLYLTIEKATAGLLSAPAAKKQKNMRAKIHYSLPGRANCFKIITTI